jgi:signal transduction histidine kinase
MIRLLTCSHPRQQIIHSSQSQKVHGTMLFSNSFAVFCNSVTALTCGTIALVMLSQVRHDTKSQLFMRLMIVMALVGGFSAYLRVAYIGGFEFRGIFRLCVVLNTALPFCVFTFAMSYLDVWTTGRRIAAFILGLIVVCVAFLLSMEFALNVPLMFSSIEILPNGLVDYDYGPTEWFNAACLVICYVAMIWTLGITIHFYRANPDKATLRLTVGLCVMIIGLMLLALPTVEEYAVEQMFYSSGSLLLVAPVLQQRLFDPMSRLNTRLQRRDNLATLIMQVSRQATSLLQLDAVLNTITQQIRKSFGFCAVTVYMPDAQGKIRARAVATDKACAPSDNIGTDGDVVLENLPHTSLYIPDVSKNNQVGIGVLYPNTRSRILLPLLTGIAEHSEHIIGLLDMQHEKVDALTDDNREMLDILARQIAIAIHNAELFGQVQSANDAKSRFIRYISHEIRNPINIILHNTDYMLNYPQLYADVPLPEVFHKDMQQMHNTGIHIWDLMSDVLDITKIEAGKLEIIIEPLDPRPVLEDVIRYGRSIIKSGVEFETRYDEHLPKILADAKRLRQVLFNLVGNAAKFTTEGSISLEAHVGGEMMQFSVRDTGKGIPDELLPTLFDAFTNASRETSDEDRNTGLGLSISKGLVEAQGGKIWVETRVGKGTVFHFSVPKISEVNVN